MRTPRHLYVTVLAVAAAVGTSACGSGTASPAASTIAAASPGASGAAPSSDWIGFRGDASRSGIGGPGPLGHPVLNWRYHAKGGVPNNLTIVGDQVSFASDDGTVYALDRATGAERWVVDVGGAPLVGPFAAEGRLYFTNRDGAAIALDATTGHPVWTSKTTYDSPSQLVGDAGKLYFGTGDGRLVALDAATGAEAWTLKPSPNTTKVDNPAVADGRVYVGTDGGGFVAVDIATHKVVWTGDTHGDDTGSASIIDGVAYIGAFIDATKGSLYAFDVATGQLRWTGAEPLLGIPAAADGLVFSATNSGLVQALDLQTGTVRWTIQLNGALRPMAVAGHVLYIAADKEQRVYAVDIATGGELWQFDVDGSNDCCVAILNGAVFVATMAGSVYSIGGDGAAVAAMPFATTAPTAAPPTQAPVADLDPSIMWSVDLDPAGIAPISQIAVDPTTGRIWIPEASADRIVIYRPDGTLVETWGESGAGPGQFDFTRTNGDGYGTVAFAKDGSFFVLDVGNRRVQHFDAHRKHVATWGTFGTSPGQFSDPIGIAVAPDGSVWVLDDARHVLEHYTAGGKVLGSFDPFAGTSSDGIGNSLTSDADGNLYVSGASPSGVYVFDATGTFERFVGEGVFTEQATNVAVDVAGRIFVTQGETKGGAPGVLVFGPDGAVLGGFAPNGDGDGQLAFPAGIALDGKGGLYLEDSIPESARLFHYGLPETLR